MPKYYFSTNGADRLEDTDGVDLPDDDAARLEAVKFLGGLIRDWPFVLSETRDMRVEVRDDGGEFVSLVTVFVTNDPSRRWPPN